MKQGISSLRELAYKIDEINKTKKDFVVNTRFLNFMYENNTDLVKEHQLFSGDYMFSINPLAHQQIATRLKIPFKYYEYMLNDAPYLLNDNVNHWFKNKPEVRMIRTLEGRTRAFLSDMYQRRDNYDLLTMVLKEMETLPPLNICSCNVDDNKLYLKVTTDKLQGEIKQGDVVKGGIVISNSEVGLGSFRIDPFIERLICNNGLIVAEWGMRKYHVGKRISHEEGNIRVFSDETLQADDQAFWLKARDMLRAAFNDEQFQDILNHLTLTTRNELEVKPKEAVERMQKMYQLKDEEKDDLLAELLKSDDMTQYGIINATTVVSKEAESYERATELERLAGHIMNLNEKQWQDIAC